MLYRREIDGLRALAVLSVILFHAGFTEFRGGFVGVDIFFVISGYLITTLIVDEIDKDSFSLLNFYEKRIRRIIPALFFMMLCTLPCAWFWMQPQDLDRFSQSLVAVPLFISNVLFYRTSGYFDAVSEIKPLLHTWSLAIEEQYYILFPIFLILVGKLGRKSIFWLLQIAAVISLLLAQWAYITHPSFGFYLLPTRGFEILIGSLISLRVNREKNLIVANQRVNQLASQFGLALVLYAIFAFDKKTPFPGFYTLVPTIGAGLIIVFSNEKNLVGKVLGSRLFVGVGLISYSTYLWHQPLYAFARLRSVSELDISIRSLLVVVSLVLGYLSWKFIETPVRQKSFLSRKKIFIWSAVAAVFFIALGLCGHSAQGVPGRLPASAAPFLFAISDKNPRQAECHFGVEIFPKPQDSCVLGNANNLQGALLGDSHADAISYALEKRLQLKDVGFLSLTYSGCPPVQGVYRADANSNSKCYEYNEQTFKFLQENPQIRYIILSARWTLYLEKNRYHNEEGGVEAGDDAYVDIVTNGDRKINDELTRKYLVKESYRKTVNDLVRAGKKVIVVYPIPEVGWDVPVLQLKKLMFNNSALEPVTTSNATFKARNKSTISAFDSIHNDDNLVRIRPDKIFCDSFIRDRCITQIDSKVLYYDDDHLSNEGAKLIVEEVMKFIK